MKSKRKILEHLANVPYTKNSAFKIIGFLRGSCLVEAGEKVIFTHNSDARNLPKTFDDFIKWLNDESEENEVLATLIEDLTEAHRDAMAEGKLTVFDRIGRQIEYLIDELGIEIPDEEDAKEE